VFLVLVTAPAEQLLTGYPVDDHRCSYCKTGLQEGDPVRAYAVQYAGDDQWSIPRLYCRECHPVDVITPTLGATELLVDGRLVTLMDAVTQRTPLSLYDAEPVTRSAPEVGDALL
jgi:hypothetical protein